MKRIFTLTLLSLTTMAFSQEIFQDGKKYGISKFGENPAESKDDSLIFRADYDEIESVYIGEGKVFAGLREDEWSFLTSNKLVNQQRYESINLDAWEGLYCVGYREGYIDIYDTEANDFLIRGVQADRLALELAPDIDNILLTQKGKDLFGLIYIEGKKEILKAEYTNIYGNYDLSNTFIAFKEGTHYLYQTDGKLIFQIDSDLDITQIVKEVAVSEGYTLKARIKKSNYLGYYHPEKKWFIEPIYDEIKFVGDDPAVAVVYNGKNYGLYFMGKMILECEWTDIEKSDKQGTVVVVTNKKGERFYAFDDGQLKLIKD